MITVTDATGQEVTIEGLDSVKQPKWTAQELYMLYDIFRACGPYKDGDYSQLFREIQKALPHRTLAGALDKLHDAQIEQTVPYYGALPRANAKERDKARLSEQLRKLAEWKQQQAQEKKSSRKPSEGISLADAEVVELLMSIRDELIESNEKLGNLHKFMAGLYRMARGDEDGNYLKVEILAHAAELHGGSGQYVVLAVDHAVPGSDQIAVQAIDGHGMPLTNELGISTLPHTRRPAETVTDASTGE
jgi:hypothetical protein